MTQNWRAWASPEGQAAFTRLATALGEWCAAWRQTELEAATTPWDTPPGWGSAFVAALATWLILDLEEAIATGVLPAAARGWVTGQLHMSWHAAWAEGEAVALEGMLGLDDDEDAREDQDG
jgi:hypothetical protein